MLAGSWLSCWQVPSFPFLIGGASTFNSSLCHSLRGLDNNTQTENQLKYGENLTSEKSYLYSKIQTNPTQSNAADLGSVDGYSDPGLSELTYVLPLITTKFY